MRSEMVSKIVNCDPVISRVVHKPFLYLQFTAPALHSSRPANAFRNVLGEVRFDAVERAFVSPVGRDDYFDVMEERAYGRFEMR